MSHGEDVLDNWEEIDEDGVSAPRDVIEHHT